MHFSLSVLFEDCIAYNGSDSFVKKWWNFDAAHSRKLYGSVQNLCLGFVVLAVGGNIKRQKEEVKIQMQFSA